MKSPEIQNQVQNELKGLLNLWSRNCYGDELMQQLSLVNIGVLEISRRCTTSPEVVLDNLPPVINLDGLSIKPVVRQGNVPIKKILRNSVGEPPIKGLRNGPKRFDYRKFEGILRQEKTARKRLGFREITPEMEEQKEAKRKEKERLRWQGIIARKNKEKGKGIGGESNKISVNMQDTKLKKLKGLVKLSEDDIKIIGQNMIESLELFAFDFVEMLGLDSHTMDLVHGNNKALSSLAPQERIEAVHRLNQIIDNLPTMHTSLSKARVHPATTFEKGVPLFFGMGGGSKMPCQGLPLDVLKMVLTGEKLRRELGLTECTVLGADVITYTNIGRTPGFTKEKIDQVLGTEITLLNEIFKRFGFLHWRAIRQSELAHHFDQKQVQELELNIKESDQVSFVGGHHYAIEMADIQLLAKNGIKLGWFIRPLSGVKEYIMDEQPFHARYALMMALLRKVHGTSLLYTHAGSRLILGADGRLQKEPPYITYTPQNRLLLSPFEDVQRKLTWAEVRNGGLALPFIKEQMQVVIDLFEQLVIPIPSQGKTEKEVLANKLQFIIDQGVKGDTHLEQLWTEAFPNSI